MKGPDSAVRSILIVAVLSTGAAWARSTKGCLNAAMGITGESIRKSLDPTRHSEANTLKDISALKKKSSVEKNTDCTETSHSGDSSIVTKNSGADRQKEKIKLLQTKIHTNLLKLFHHIKQKKLQGDVLGNRKDLGSLDNPGKAAKIVSDKVFSLPFVTGVLRELNKSKLQDANTKAMGSPANVTTEKALTKVENDLTSVQNTSTNQNSSSSLKALDKVVSHILQNSSQAKQQKDKLQDALRLANTTVSSGNPKSTNSKGDHSENVDTKQDPYAAIAAGPDHPKLPPGLKVPENDDSVVPVSHNHRKENEDSDEDKAPEALLEAPEAPEAPNQLPGAGMGGDANPDLADVSMMQRMRMEAMQDQMQDSMRAQAMNGMQGMNGMGSMPRMNGMQGDDMMGGMNSMQGDTIMGGMGRMGGMTRMNGMRGDAMMGDMGTMTGMNGMQGDGMMTGMGRMAGMGGMLGMGGMGGMAGYSDMVYGRDDILDDRYRGPYGMEGIGDGEPEPSTHMADESAVGRDQVPLGYDERLRRPFSRYFHDPEMDDEGYADGGDDDDDDDEGDDRLGAISGHPRSSFDEPYDDEGPENDMDDGYMDDYERKTKIPKVEDSKSGVKQESLAKTSKKDKTKKEAKSITES